MAGRKNATQINFLVKGINATGHVFKEIASSAMRVGKAGAMFGAAAAGAAAVAFAATAKSLGHLSDVAMQAGASTEDITKMATAMDVLGIKSSSPEALASAFQKMTKATGQTGVEGFKKCVAAIAEMETAEERSAAAMATFGKSGLDFMPIIEGVRQNGIEAVESVIAAMPGISQGAADAGDDVADAMTIMTAGAKSLWSEAVGEICALLGSQFEGGVRGAAMKATAHMEYYAKYAWRVCVASFENIGKAYHAMSADWGETFRQMFTMLWETFKSFAKFLWEEIKNIGAVIRDFLKQVWSGLNGDGFDWHKVVENANFAEVAKNFADEVKAAAGGVSIFDGVEWSKVDMSDLDARLESSLATAAKAAASVGQAAVAVTAQDAAKDTAEKIGQATASARNELMLGGSYKAATMSLRGDYGKGKETVRAINAVKSVNEKILEASERTATALDGIGVLS